MSSSFQIQNINPPMPDLITAPQQRRVSLIEPEKTELKDLNENLLSIKKNILEKKEFALSSYQLNTVLSEGWKIEKKLSPKIKFRIEIFYFLKDLLELILQKNLWIDFAILDPEDSHLVAISDAAIPYIKILGSLVADEPVAKKEISDIYSKTEEFLKERLKDYRKNSFDRLPLYVNLTTILSSLHYLQGSGDLSDYKQSSWGFEIVFDLTKLIASLFIVCYVFSITFEKSTEIQKDLLIASFVASLITVLSKDGIDVSKKLIKFFKKGPVYEQYALSKKGWENFKNIYDEAITSRFLVKIGKDSELEFEKAYHLFKKLELHFKSCNHAEKKSYIGQLNIENGKVTIKKSLTFAFLLFQNEDSLIFDSKKDSCSVDFNKSIKEDYPFHKINHLIIQKLFGIIASLDISVDKDVLQNCLELVVSRCYLELNDVIVAFMKEKTKEQSFLNLIEDTNYEWGTLIESLENMGIKKERKSKNFWLNNGNS